MPEIVQHIRFSDEERALFARILSASILCAHDNEDDRVTAVRRATNSGEVWSSEQLAKLANHLSVAITDRERTVEALKSSDVVGAEGAAESAAQWIPDMRRAWGTTCEALSLVTP